MIDVFHRKLDEIESIPKKIQEIIICTLTCVSFKWTACVEGSRFIQCIDTVWQCVWYMICVDDTNILRNENTFFVFSMYNSLHVCEN